MPCAATAPWTACGSAQIVFKDKRARLDLEAIIHPAVSKAINDFFDTLPKRTPFAVADIPLLFETGRDKDFDAVIVVACPREMQLQRLMERNKLSKEDAERRLARAVADRSRRSRRRPTSSATTAPSTTPTRRSTR